MSPRSILPLACQNPDGHWWLETGGGYQWNLKQIPSAGDVLQLKDVIYTDNFDRYPALQDMQVEFIESESGVRGRYSRDKNRITINMDGILKELRQNGAGEAIGRRFMPLGIIRVLAHEIDHYIADIEGFENGSQPTERAVNI
jgi:hypothetical protein